MAAAAAEERLVVALEARIRDFEKNMLRSRRVANDNLEAIERRAQQMAPRLQAAMTKAGAATTGMTGALSRFLAIGGIGLGVREVVQFADAWTRASNQLKVAGLSGDDLKSTMGQLFDAAQRQGAPLEALVTLYGRASQSATELGASNADLVRFSEDVAIALRVAGTSSNEASGALLQLAQLLGSSRVQAEEFNSVNEAARPILQAVANGMEEAGGSVSKLKALVSDGKVSNVAFFKAFQAGAEGLRQQAGAADSTIAQAFERVSNALTKAIGELDKTSGSSQNAVKNLGHVADAIGKIPAAVNMAADKLAELQKWLNQAGNNSFWTKFGKLMGVQFTPEEAAKFGITATPQTDPRQAGINMLKAGMGSQLSQDAGMLGEKPVTNPIKASDYPVIGGKEKKTVDHFEREVDTLQRRTEAMRVEIEVMNKSTFEAEKARATQELLTEAKRQYGEDISPQVRARIEEEATAYAQVSAAMETAYAEQQRSLQLQQELGSLAANTFSGLADGTTTWADALKSVTKRLTDLVLQAALLGDGPLGNMFGTGGSSNKTGGIIGSLFNGGSGGGGIGSIFSKLFSAFTGTPAAATGGMIRGPGTGTSDSILARLSNGEYVVNAKAAAMNRPLLESINSGRISSLPAFSTGGMVGGASTAASAGSPMVKVDVHTLPGTTADVQPRQNADGSISMDVIMRQVKGELMNDLKNRGPYAKAHEGIYGVTRKLV